MWVLAQAVSGVILSYNGLNAYIFIERIVLKYSGNLKISGVLDVRSRDDRIISNGPIKLKDFKKKLMSEC